MFVYGEKNKMNIATVSSGVNSVQYNAVSNQEKQKLKGTGKFCPGNQNLVN